MKFRIRQWLVERLRRTRFRHARLVGFVVVPIFAACNDTTGPNRFVSITPVSQTVALQTVSGGKVLQTSVTLTNTGKAPISWSACGVSLERKASGFVALDNAGQEWSTVWAVSCAVLEAAAGADFIPPPILRPGESVTIPIYARVSQTDFPRFDGAPGLYRVHLLLLTEIIRQTRVLPHDLSVSDPFTLTAG